VAKNKEMNNNQISKSLLELSDAIDQLALIIAQQKNIDNDLHVKQFAVIVNKFKDSTKKLDNNTEGFNTQVQNKHKKGFLQDWLQQKNIYIGKNTNNLKVDEKLYEVADFLADHYKHLKDFYSQLKRHQNVRTDFINHTKNKQTIKYIRKWCNMLHKNKIIDTFEFLNQSSIDVDIAKIHEATYFINGYWLEILLRKEIALLMRKNINKINSFDILVQVELVKPNKKSTELDILLMINNKVFWFECKSGNIGKYYKIFEKHRKLLELNEKQSFIVVPTMQMHQEKAAKENSGMSLLYATNLENQLQKYLF